MTGVLDRSEWLHTSAPRPDARLRLYCFPYAGGGTGIFRPWPAGLSGDVEVSAVALPGRERRFNERALTSVEALAERLVPALRADLDRPFAIFGHSMGAILGYEVTRRLSPGVRPVCLLVSGARAPHRPGGERHRLPEHRFVEAIRDLGGTPPELLANDELMTLMLPTIRADFTAAETYRRQPDPLPGCPIVAFGATGDPVVSRDDLAAWAEHTSAGFQMHELPGNHFFLNSARAALLQLVDRELALHLGTG